MQFFYQATAEHTTNYTRVSKLFEIFRRACTGSATTKCAGQAITWPGLLSAAQTTYGSATNASYLRFRDTGVSAGLDR